MTAENQQAPAKKDANPNAKAEAKGGAADTKPGEEKVSAKKPKHAAKTSKKSHHARNWLGGLGLIIALGAAGGVYYVYTLIQANKPIFDAQSQRLGANSSKIDSLRTALSDTRSALQQETEARTKAEAEHQALATAMASLESKLGRTTLAWRLAEVEYLLTIANDRLSLEQDRKTAMAILETADSKLQSLGDPAMLPVRQKISQEITALQAIEEVDITGIVLDLGSLAESIEHWPLIDKTAPGVLGKDQAQTTERALTWQEIPKAVWDDLKGLVQVRRHEQPVEPLLPPDQAWFLRENLRLKLEQARLALLREDEALFQQLLTEAQAWLRLFFDGDSTAVANASETLKKFQGTTLRPSLPDISGSLRELRSQVERLGQQVSGQ